MTRVLEDVTTGVAGRTLAIERDGHAGAPLDVAITLPRLRGVDAESAGTIELVDVDSEALEPIVLTEMSGLGDVRAAR